MALPVILDTDIGGDIDDTWALAFLLRCPELDLKLVVTNTGDTAYRARLAAKLLDAAGRDDIPVAAGEGDGLPASWDYQRPWVAGYDPSLRRGPVTGDGTRRLVEAIHGSTTPPVVIAIGRMTNLAAALRADPGIAARCGIAAMAGDLRPGPGGGPPEPENNIVMDIESARTVFAAPWRTRVVTPLDTCGSVRLDGERYRRIADSKDPLTRAVIENYRLWAASGGGGDPDTHSSTLYDTLAVWLAFTNDFIEISETGLRITPDGRTIPAPAHRAWRCATRWTDRDAFLDLLSTRLS